MAITSFPFDNQDTDESQFSRLFRELQDSGVADSISGSDFKLTADGTGMYVFVQPGFAILRGHAVYSTAVEKVAVAAASGTLRTDRVALRLDPTSNSITLVPLTGTPGSGAPGVTQTDTGVFEMSLGSVPVAAGAVAIAADVPVDERQFLGSRVGVWTTAIRPSAPRRSKLGFNVTTGKWEFYNGSGTGWTDLIPATADNATRWNGYTVTVSKTQPSGTPTTDRIWIQPTS
ncbi:hypothetical protein [Micromonospora sp. NPDC048839]|uniref:hypothetical protein n=1 Tax=Micromonospora sp. NPDC048839 TaxID=3155641 RepID=UPI00340AD56D